VLRSQGIVAKIHPQFLTVVKLRMHNFWGVMLCRCVIHSRIFEGTRIFRTVGSHSSKITKSQIWRPEYRESCLLLHFILPVIFSDFYWHLFIWVNYRGIIFLNFVPMRNVNYYFSLNLLPFLQFVTLFYALLG